MFPVAWDVLVAGRDVDDCSQRKLQCLFMPLHVIVGHSVCSRCKPGANNRLNLFFFPVTRKGGGVHSGWGMSVVSAQGAGATVTSTR